MNHPQGLEMVWVGGELLYGRAAVVQALKPKQCEKLPVHGSSKRVCVVGTKNPVTKSGQTLSVIRQTLLNRYPQLSPLVP